MAIQVQQFALVGIAILVVGYWAKWAYERYKISRLGFTAPIVPSKAPFGLDLAYNAFMATHRATDLAFWDDIFNRSPNPSSKNAEAWVCGARLIFTADPVNIKAILASQFQDYGKGEKFHEDWKDFLGDSIFTTDGDLWHTSRQLLRPQFVKERVRDLDIFESHIQKVIGHIGDQGKPVDIADLFYRFTLDSATDFLLGHPVGSLDKTQDGFANAFNDVQRRQNFVPRLGPLNKFMPKTAFWKGLRVMDGFVEQFIESVLKMKSEDLQEVKNKSFLQNLAASGIRDRKVVRDQMIAILLAGRDTTAGGLSFTFLELSRHPDKFARLRKEILDIIGPTARPEYEDLKKMKYLQHTINEVLRLYPGVPMNMRYSLIDTTLPTGGGPDGLQPIGVPKGTPIAYSTIYMQRRPDLYPDPDNKQPAPHVFAPERWETWHPPSWQYIPFNGGPRICVGQQFALTEMGYTICRILQKYERMDGLTPTSGPQFKSEIVISPYDGVKVALWEASGQKK